MSYNLAILEGHLDAFDDVAIVAERRLGASHKTFSSTEIRCCKDLFCWHISNEILALGIETAS